MKITFLGTNGWYDTDCGSSICTLIESREAYILLDAGNGIYKADRIIKPDKPVFLFLSHFHLDHIEGLHILAKFKFKSLTIIGQPGTKNTIRGFLAPRFSVPLNKLHFPCKVIDVEPGWHDEQLKFRCLPLVHSTKCFGYRLEIDGKAVSYCTDTGYCDNSVKLSRNTDLLISECAFFDMTEPNWPHMTPKLAAKLAIAAGTKKLALTHFDANVYRDMGMRKRAEGISKREFKHSFAAIDDMSIKI